MVDKMEQFGATSKHKDLFTGYGKNNVKRAKDYTVRMHFNERICEEQLVVDIKTTSCELITLRNIGASEVFQIVGKITLPCVVDWADDSDIYAVSLLDGTVLLVEKELFIGISRVTCADYLAVIAGIKQAVNGSKFLLDYTVTPAFIEKQQELEHET